MVWDEVGKVFKPEEKKEEETFKIEIEEGNDQFVKTKKKSRTLEIIVKG